MTSRTAIQYTYRAPFGRPSMYDQGPFYLRDDGRDPHVQAMEHVAGRGDTLVSAHRVEVDLDVVERMLEG